MPNELMTWGSYDKFAESAKEEEGFFWKDAE